MRAGAGWATAIGAERFPPNEPPVADSRKSGGPSEIKRAIWLPLPQDARMTFNKNIGMLLLAVYLILVGLIALTGLPFGILPAIVALIAGIFILIGR